MARPASIEHRVGDALVTIDVNERHDPGPGFRDLVFRVRRGAQISVYRCRLIDADIPAFDPYETAAYLLTQAHGRNLVFVYTDPRPPPK